MLSPQLRLLLAKLGMCCLNFTGILCVQLLLLMRYSIQFLPMTLQEEAAQWNIIIMGAANRQLWDQGDEIQLWNQENGNRGNYNRYLLPWRANNSNCATPRGTMSSMNISYIRISGYQDIRQKHIKSPKALFLHDCIMRRKSNQPLHYYDHTSPPSHTPPAFLHHLLTPIHPPYAPKLSPFSLLPTPPHSPPLPHPHTLTFSSTLILVLSCSPEVF